MSNLLNKFTEKIQGHHDKEDQDSSQRRQTRSGGQQQQKQQGDQQFNSESGMGQSQPSSWGMNDDVDNNNMGRNTGGGGSNFSTSKNQGDVNDDYINMGTQQQMGSQQQGARDFNMGGSGGRQGAGIMGMGDQDDNQDQDFGNDQYMSGNKQRTTRTQGRGQQDSSNLLEQDNEW